MLILSCGQRLLCSALPMFKDRLGPPWVYVFDHRAKNFSAELEAPLSRFHQEALDTDAELWLQGFLDDCTFDHGAQQLRLLYEQLINEHIGSQCDGLMTAFYSRPCGAHRPQNTAPDRLERSDPAAIGALAEPAA
jgi:hypothetical protein